MAQLDRLFIGTGEYVRADEAVNTVTRLQAENARLRAALATARNYIEDEPMVANAVVVREGETVSRDTIQAGKHPTLLQVIDEALGSDEQNVERAEP